MVSAVWGPGQLENAVDLLFSICLGLKQKTSPQAKPSDLLVSQLHGMALLWFAWYGPEGRGQSWPLRCDCHSLAVPSTALCSAYRYRTFASAPCSTSNFCVCECEQMRASIMPRLDIAFGVVQLD